MNKNAGQMPISFLYMQKDLEQDNGHFLVLVLKRSGILSVKIVHKRMGQNGESGHPIFRATSPLSRSRLKSKGHGKLSIHYAADQEAIETFFA